MFTWLLYNTLCALPLALLALFARRLLRATPAVEHALWLCVLVRLVLPPFPDLAPAAPATSPLVRASDPSLGDALVASTTRLLGPNWSTWGERVLLVLFIALLAFVVARELVRARAVERCVGRAESARDELETHVHTLATHLGAAPPRVRVSSEAAGPFLWSLRRPVLVLPAGEALPAPTVLAHEFAHIRRRDHWTAWLELVVQGFHFWNPLFWLARRRLHVAAELACDQWVVERFPDQRRAFATALVDTAERAAGARFVPRAVQAIGMDRRDFEERLVRILRSDGRVRVQHGLLAAALLGATLTLPGLAAPTLAEFRRACPELPQGFDRETWRRSLAAADEVLSKDPRHMQATQQRGIALLGLARYEEAVAAFERQAELGFQPAKATYNQACAWAKLGDHERALACLDEAAALGLPVWEYAPTDPDLAPLRELPAFAERIEGR